MNTIKDGWIREEMEATIERNQPDELLYVPIWVSMNPPDCAWAQDVCVRLSRHPHFNVRGNAILGLGHLARTCGVLDEVVVKPLIEGALLDSDEYVRSKANTAASDIVWYLGWQIDGYQSDEE
jgi:hypothetical protein